MCFTHYVGEIHPLGQIVIQYDSRCGSVIFTVGTLNNLFVFSSGDGHLDSSWCCVGIVMHTGRNLVREDSEEGYRRHVVSPDQIT